MKSEKEVYSSTHFSCIRFHAVLYTVHHILHTLFAVRYPKFFVLSDLWFKILTFSALCNFTASSLNMPLFIALQQADQEKMGVAYALVRRKFLFAKNLHVKEGSRDIISKVFIESGNTQRGFRHPFKQDFLIKEWMQKQYLSVNGNLCEKQFQH